MRDTDLFPRVTGKPDTETIYSYPSAVQSGSSWRKRFSRMDCSTETFHGVFRVVYTDRVGTVDWGRRVRITFRIFWTGSRLFIILTAYTGALEIFSIEFHPGWLTRLIRLDRRKRNSIRFIVNFMTYARIIGGNSWAGTSGAGSVIGRTSEIRRSLSVKRSKPVIIGRVDWNNHGRMDGGVVGGQVKGSRGSRYLGRRVRYLWAEWIDRDQISVWLVIEKKGKGWINS